jgi:hypothetical protein
MFTFSVTESRELCETAVCLAVYGKQFELLWPPILAMRVLWSACISLPTVHALLAVHVAAVSAFCLLNNFRSLILLVHWNFLHTPHARVVSTWTVPLKQLLAILYLYKVDTGNTFD